ncbi:DUF1116 domain-containing protein [Verticiella sediminum]|uniref:DUF1116 domain-containing protein n=1 Tax=Verticiella sediminum TaxID=1247510 RepID=A0A556A6G8_9BURK|nr:DUF1116 domain-containing protein [Verticiella sediminum]TSH88483.1 DUF1116 domain-containing protein [Verticiella sediminum]
MNAGLAPAALQGARLTGVRQRAQAVPAVPADVLLHAGPPYADGAAPAPVRNAAAQALVYEGAANDLAHGLRLLADGAYRLAPAQDHGVVTPLAQVVSASMPVFAVGDEALLIHAPVLEGAPPALRFGAPDPACVAALHAAAADALGPLAAHLAGKPVQIHDLAVQALAQGDECHARTGAANAALVAALAGLAGDCRARIGANPGYVLPILMAACAWALRRHGEIEAVGGNGVAFGLRPRGQAAWRTVPATAPVGTVMRPELPALGAIGDSAVIDFAGLGGQALAAAPALRAEWAACLPADWAARRALCDAASGLVSLARVADTALVPIVHLAIVGADARGGLAGRGFYLPSPELFRFLSAEHPA